MKNILIVTLIVFASSINANESNQETNDTNRSLKAEIRLTHSILNLVDGKAGLMDADKIRGINYMIQEIGRILYGVLDKTSGKQIGKYKYNGHLHTLMSLAILENEANKLPDDAKELLIKLKSDLAKITDPNLEESRGSKHFMKILIHEWASKANKLNSLVVQWSNLPDNADQDDFRKTLTNFRKTSNYCSDLLQFLHALKKSCPKASKLYYDKYNRPA